MATLEPLEYEVETCDMEEGPLVLNSPPVLRRHLNSFDTCQPQRARAANFWGGSL